VLGGNTQQLDRPTRGIHLLDRTMGEALGKLYVARYFPPEAKAKADQLVSNLLKAYEADIQTLDWMSPATRAKALDKIRQFTPKIGYPSHWRDYSAYVVRRDDLPAAAAGHPDVGKAVAALAGGMVGEPVQGADEAVESADRNVLSPGWKLCRVSHAADIVGFLAAVKRAPMGWRRRPGAQMESSEWPH